MRNVILVFALVAAGLTVAPRVHAADLQIIANSSVGVSSLSADEVKSVFLGTKTTLKNGSHVEPVLETDSVVHEIFLKEYLGKTDAALQAYYRSLVFTGRASMPKTFKSDSEVMAYVAKTKGAVGYIGSGARTSGVKTLQVK